MEGLSLGLEQRYCQLRWVATKMKEHRGTIPTVIQNNSYCQLRGMPAERHLSDPASTTSSTMKRPQELLQAGSEGATQKLPLQTQSPAQVPSINLVSPHLRQTLYFPFQMKPCIRKRNIGTSEHRVVSWILPNLLDLRLSKVLQGTLFMSVTYAAALREALLHSG